MMYVHLQDQTFFYIPLPFYFKMLIKAAVELPDVGEVEADRQLEVQLNCGTLMVAADGILDLNVNLHRNDTSNQRKPSCCFTVKAHHYCGTQLTFGP